VAMRIPATPTATVTRRTRRPELRVTIFLVDGRASWPSPLRDFRRGSCRALQPAHVVRASPRTWVRIAAQISVLPSARIFALLGVYDRAGARVRLCRPWQMRRTNALRGGRLTAGGFPGQVNDGAQPRAAVPSPQGCDRRALTQVRSPVRANAEAAHCEQPV